MCGTHFIWVSIGTYVDNGTTKVSISAEIRARVQGSTPGIWNKSYGLKHVPGHWFDKLTSNLKNMVLAASPHDPFVYMVSLTPGGGPVYIGLYVDNFFYFRKYDAV